MATVIVAAILLLVAVPFCIFAVDVGNWFVHKRHLQNQADAAALAGGSAFRFPDCDDTAIVNSALQYSGKGDGTVAYNGNNPTVAASRLHAIVNGPTFYNQSKPPDADLAGGPGPSTSPCTTAMVDVKMTENDLPFFFGSGIVPTINAQARVKLFKANLGEGLLPLAVQEAAPKKVRAYVVDESTGNTVNDASGNPVSLLLSAHGSSGGLQQFDNESAPLNFTPPAGVSKLGVRLALSGSTSTTCLQPLVACYDSTATTQGLAFIPTWTDQNVPTSGQPPVSRAVTVGAVTCGAGSFITNTSACTVAVNATVKWNPAVTSADLGTKTFLKASLNGATAVNMTYSSATSSWTANLSVPAGTIGPLPINIDWEQQVGTVSGNTCKVGGGNKCTGTFAAVQRVFWNDPTVQTSRGGPVGRLDVINNNTHLPVTTLQRCSSTFPSCSVPLVFEVGVKGSLTLSQTNDPPVSLRVENNGGGQTQAVDCDPARDPVDSAAYGCQPPYQTNDGTPCTSPQTPLSCVPVETGTFANKLAKGLNIRFLCVPPGNPGQCGGSGPTSWDGKPSVCPPAGQFGHNNWPNYPTGDPRLVAVFITPFGTFQGSGNGLVPIIKFGAFYVTGYASNGAGFNNPCIGNGDQFAPGTTGDTGVVSGHYVIDVLPNNSGSSGESCDLTDVSACVAVLVK